MDNMKELYELCETISEAISEANEKIRSSGGKLSGSDIDYIDKLTHALKSIKAVMVMMEEEEGESSAYEGGRSRAGGGYRYSRNTSYDGSGSYARGRRYAKRNSMGRYSRYSRNGGSYTCENDEYLDTLKEAMESAPDNQTRQKIQSMIQELEDM